MKSGTKKVVKILISLLYIIWGITAPMTALRAIIDLDVAAICGAAVGILMLLAGIFGLFGLKKIKCRIFGIVIFVFALLALIPAILAFNLFNVIRPAITALLAWLFIVCL